MEVFFDVSSPFKFWFSSSLFASFVSVSQQHWSDPLSLSLSTSRPSWSASSYEYFCFTCCTDIFSATCYFYLSKLFKDNVAVNSYMVAILRPKLLYIQLFNHTQNSPINEIGGCIKRDFSSEAEDIEHFRRLLPVRYSDRQEWNESCDKVESTYVPIHLFYNEIMPCACQDLSKYPCFSAHIPHVYKMT